MEDNNKTIETDIYELFRELRNQEKRAYRDVCHPLNANVRKELTEAIFAAYDEFIENSENEE